MEVCEEAPKWTNTYEVIVLEDDPTPKCSSCSVCNQCLAGREVYLRDDRKFCWECFGKFYGQKCVVCQKFISGTTQVTFIYYDSRLWHRECFKCSRCGKFLERYGTALEDKSIQCTNCGTHVKFQS